MAMLSPPTKRGRSKAFISVYLRREIPPQRGKRYWDWTPVTRDEEGLSPIRRHGQGPAPWVLPHLGGLRALPPFSGCPLRRPSRVSSTGTGGRQVNGPMQHRLAHDCPLCQARSKAAERHTARPHVRTMRYLPWIAPLALCVVLLPFVDGVARGLFAGIVVGLAAGAGLSWLATRLNRHIAAKTLASTTDELKAEADQRVSMVIRQFEWAVNDVAN